MLARGKKSAETRMFFSTAIIKEIRCCYARRELFFFGFRGSAFEKKKPQKRPILRNTKKRILIARGAKVAQAFYLDDLREIDHLAA